MEFPKDSLTRYYHLIRLLDRLVHEIENEYPNDQRWFLFSLRITRKLLVHCRSFCLHSADTLFDEETEKIEKNTFVDVPGLFANLRIQIDCYSTLHHIFFDNKDWEIKRLRFDLWRYDSHVEKIKLNIGTDYEIQQLTELKANIEKNSSFNSFESNKRKFIFNHEKQFANWKFFPSRLSRNNHKPKWTELFELTGIKLEVMEKAYGFLSMYVHSNYFSVSHLTEIDKKESYEARSFAILFSSFLICFAIDDIISKFSPGKVFLESLEK